MAGKKITDLTTETSLSDQHLLIIQENSDVAETKRTTLSLLRDWLDGLTFEDISTYFSEGANITISIDSETEKITLSADSSINVWSAKTDYSVNDIILNETTLYKCSSDHTSGDTFDSANWTVLTGEKGADGTSPTVSIETTETGATITITSEGEPVTTTILNGTDGTTPHINEDDKHWYIGETDTGVVAEGQDGISPTATVVQTDTGATITIVSGETTSTVDLSNGVTPHIDETTNHWFIGETDTGVLAKGTTTVTTTAVVLTGILTADGWTGETAPYTQVVTISGIDETSRPYLYPILSDTVETGLEQQKQWGYITKAVTSADTITFSCYKTKPTIDINFEAEVR